MTFQQIFLPNKSTSKIMFRKVEKHSVSFFCELHAFQKKVADIKSNLWSVINSPLSRISKF